MDSLDIDKLLDEINNSSTKTSKNVNLIKSEKKEKQG